jgi:hypothetical protein
MSLKGWLNERPGAKLDEAEAARRSGAPSDSTAPPIVEIREFDPRTELSADTRALLTAIEYNATRSAGRIITHLWLIFVLLPIVLYVVYEMATH